MVSMELCPPRHPEVRVRKIDGRGPVTSALVSAVLAGWAGRQLLAAIWRRMVSATSFGARTVG
jgi:hypothetical protein